MSVPCQAIASAGTQTDLPSPALSGSLRVLLRVAASVGLLLGVSACGEDSTPTEAKGTPCETISDCTGEQTCDPISKLCVARECDVAAGKNCAPGKTCQAYRCVTGLNPGDASGGDAEDGGVQDSTAGTDATTQPADKTCGKCTDSSECGGLDCVLLVNGNFCAKACTGNSDCGAGFTCQEVQAGGKKHCVTGTYECKGCLVDGCPEGQECNVKTTTCTQPKQVCESCNLDADCANGSRCTKLGNGKVCAPDCSNGQACPDNSQCVPLAAGAGSVCAYNAKNCCYGAACTSNCTDCATACVAGNCAECTKDADCTGAKCNLATYSCITGQQCPPAEDPDLKYLKSDTSTCVECLNNTHCGSSSKGKSCDQATNTCGASGGPEECKVCGGSYPSCTQINGEWSCVECATDDDCKAKNKGTCSATTYTCSNGGTGVTPPTGDCKTDADCPADLNGNFTIKCDVGTGLCYDIDGKCDNVTAWCNSGQGSNCKFPDELLGGIGGAIPGGGGGTTTANVGQCTCPVGGGSSGGTATWDTQCDFQKLLKPELANCNCATDPTNANCQGLLGSCCKGGSGGSTGSPLDIFACLATMQSGGGGSPSPACFASITCSQGLDCFFSVLGGTGSAPSGTCGTAALGFP